MHNKKKYKLRTENPKLRGFTLIEVLVVLGITSLLAGMVLTYSSRSRTQTALYVETAKLAQIILKAKSYSIATYVSGGEAAPCGYGIHVDYAANSYEFFGYKPIGIDCSAIGDGSVDMGNKGYNVIETYALGGGIIISAKPPADGAVPVSDIIFVPPDPKTMIWPLDGGAAGVGIGNIRLATQDGLAKTDVQVSSAGQITF